MENETKKGLNMKTKKERKRQFLIGLTKLTRETGITIGGCGCCGSPSIDEASDAELSDPDAGYGYGYAGEVAWISHADDYDWKNFSDSIVRSNALIHRPRSGPVELLVGPRPGKETTWTCLY